MQKITKKLAVFLMLQGILLSPLTVLAQADFNPQFIISDPELQDYNSWTRGDVQKFLDEKGSYLRQFSTEDASGTVKTAADIIYDTAQTYQINPKFLVVTLQKEQSLITDDTPTQKQLDWATGYAVCDGCYLDDPKVLKVKGFGKQVDGAAGIMRWYYDNKDKSFVKKIDTPIRIDSQDVTPQSWATAFLYTYTPHLHGNRNFWRIWTTWFEQTYPNGTLLKTATGDDYWLLQDGVRRKFRNKTALITRLDPKLAVSISDLELSNYKLGPEIFLPNYTVVQAPSGTYLVDFDTVRPFESEEVIRKIGFNPQEIMAVQDSDLSGMSLGPVISASTTKPLGVIYQITDAPNTYYLFKDDMLYPLADKQVIDTNFKNLTTEKHKLKELVKLSIADLPIKFKDGTLFKIADSGAIYAIDRGKKRRIADEETFQGLGYKHSNIITVALTTALNIPEGDRIFLNSNLLSSKDKYLGDSETPVIDQLKSKLPAYLVAEYPSGRIISGKNIDTKRSIASLTKLLTAYEAINQNLNLNQSTVYKSKKFAIGNNTVGFRENEKIKNVDIFNAMLVGSANNAARMIAAGAASSEKKLVDDINERLDEWGADDTTIADVTGLSGKNKSTARDLLKIFTKVLVNETIKTALGRVDYSFRGNLAKHSFKNTNAIIKVPNRNYRILASKTGYTDAAGETIIMLIESKKTKKQFTVITLGNSSTYQRRFDDPNKIAEWISTGKVQIAAND